MGPLLFLLAIHALCFLAAAAAAGEERSEERKLGVKAGSSSAPARARCTFVVFLLFLRTRVLTLELCCYCSEPHPQKVKNSTAT